MAELPDPEWIAWAAGILGAADASRVRGMRERGGPWLVEVDGGRAAGVLRAATTPSGLEQARTEVAALEHAVRHGGIVPRLLGGFEGDDLALELIEVVDGDSAVPVPRDDARLHRFGAEVARIAAMPAPSGLPLRTSPIEGLDFAAMRRAAAHPLLERGSAALARHGVPAADEVFVHGDLWLGNSLWRDADLVAVIDWDHAGRGPAGIDLGAVRLDAALWWGADAADAVLAGWEAEAGRPAADVAYWDVVAAVATPPDLAWFVPTMIADGRRPDLDRPTLVRRRDAFLERSLGRLEA